MSLDDEKEVCRRGQLAEAILNNTQYNPGYHSTEWPTSLLPNVTRRRKKDPCNRWISRVRRISSANHLFQPFLSISLSYFHRFLLGKRGSPPKSKRSMKRWYACNALRALHFSIPTSKWLLVQIFVSVRFSHSNYGDSTRSRYVLYHFTDDIYIYIYTLEQAKRRRREADEKHRDKRKIEEDVTRRLWCSSLESTYNVGRWPAFFLYIYIRIYIYIYKKTDYRKPRIKLFLFKV